eukprot:751029-Hanusia_phi.AAC.1
MEEATREALEGPGQVRTGTSPHVMSSTGRAGKVRGRRATEEWEPKERGGREGGRDREGRDREGGRDSCLLYTSPSPRDRTRS